MASKKEFSSVQCLMLFVVLLGLSTFGVVKGGARSLSKEEIDEDLEIERQLRILNKPPIKTIHTEWGDILDCVDIYKQPALDHPLLKNHKIQMKPSFSLKGGLKDEKPSSTQTNDRPSIFKRPDGGCPKGTVPIRRTHKEDLIRAKSLSANISFGESKNKFAGQNLVGVKYDIEGEIYDGAAALINIYNPELSSDDQFSSAEIAVENGPDGIRVGWMVNPEIFGDRNTHLFTAWTTDGYQKTCYNYQCSGFVQVDSAVGPGSLINKTSVYGGEQSTIQFQLYKEKYTGDWWLTIQDIVDVGYWPKDLFGSLSKGCTQIYWGGHVKAAANGLSPNMGSGHMPDSRNYQTACYYKNLQVLQYYDGTRMYVNPKENHVRRVTECNYYGVEYYGFQRGGFGHTFLFGGHGGKCD